MAMKRCNNGHYFDSDKHTTCPSCGVQDLHIEPTIARGRGGAASPSPRQDFDVPTRPRGRPGGAPARDAGTDEKTRPRGQPAPALERDPGATVGVVRKKMGIDPVVGWLVCVEGAERGRDYRIRTERNFIGRDPKMDICIGGDDAISRENHAIISFNPKKSSFLIMPGEGRGIVYLNDEEVATPTELQAYDTIELGQTKLMFIPFCGEKFKWA